MDKVNGVCCACGYTGNEEITCPVRDPDSCCDCWWEGPTPMKENN